MEYLPRGNLKKKNSFDLRSKGEKARDAEQRGGPEGGRSGCSQGRFKGEVAPQRADS